MARVASSIRVALSNVRSNVFPWNVYRYIMRPSLLLTVLPLLAFAQPEPPDFCFVISEPGDADKPLSRTYVVQQQFRERVLYYDSDRSWLKPDTTITLQGGPLFQATDERWQVYHPWEAQANSCVLVIAGKDTMRVDLPEDPQVLNERAWHRYERGSPEVIRFRKGRSSMVELLNGSETQRVSEALARKLKTEHDKVYKQSLADLEEYYRKQPPPEPPRTPTVPPAPMTEEDWKVFWAEQPPLKEAMVERTSADTVWLRITGRVMLDGGCASGMPLFGIEMLTDTGWKERLPRREGQMDCGMPWGDWEERVVMLPPLLWWVGANSSEPTKELKPGTYRIVLMGGNMKEVRTEEFRLE